MRPILKPIYVLIHSPLVDALTWKLVADDLRQRGQIARVPTLNDTTDSKQPYWQQHAFSVSQALVEVPKNIPMILVAHSGAGPLLPAMRQSIPNPIHAYVFVDGGIPRNNATRLELMNLEDAQWAQDFQTHLEGGGRFPTWSSDELAAIIPDQQTREQLVAELRPRGLDFFSEPMPVFDGWPDAPCAYIQLSNAYDWDAVQAQEWGWPTFKIDAGHFHMLVEPVEVTNLILTAVNQLT